MNKIKWYEIGKIAGLVGLVVAVGAAAGAIAVLVILPANSFLFCHLGSTTSTASGANTSSTEPTLVRVESRLTAPLLPPKFITRRASPVATIYRKPVGASLEERGLTVDRMLGQAVALTSDGWLVTTAGVIGTRSRAELTVWLNGKSYTPARMVKDKINNTVFIKIQAADLSSPVFGEVINLAVSSEVWLETSAGVFSPTLAVALNQALPDVESISSERAVRRIVLHDATQEGDQGAPAWDVQGALVGLVESKTGERISIIPSSAIATSFSGLLNTGTIKHAALGVYAVDLTAWRIEGDRGTLPASGALLKANRRLGKPAIVKSSAAERAGLQAGDVILSVERDMLDGTADLGEVLSEYRPETEVTLHINRDGKELDVKVKLGSAVTSEEIK